MNTLLEQMKVNIISEDGVIQRIYEKVKTMRHAKDVLEDL